MNIGDEFYFAGCWNTCEGRWRVIGDADDIGQVHCEPIDGEALLYHKGDHNRFWASDVIRWTTPQKTDHSSTE